MTEGYIRPEIMAFAEAMETTLRKHDHKGGWEECRLNYLMDGVHRELKEADEEWDVKNFRGNYLRVSEELVDVANFCMMFWGNTQRYYNRKIGVPKVAGSQMVQCTEYHSHRCDNGCETKGCYFHPDKKHGLDVDHPITIRTFIERFGCGRYTPSCYEDAHLAGFQNGYEEGYEIGKAQCETHHEEMLWKEREGVLDLILHELSQRSAIGLALERIGNAHGEKSWLRDELLKVIERGDEK